MHVTKRSGEEIEKSGGNWGRFVGDLWRSGKKPEKFMRFGGDIGRYWSSTRRSRVDTGTSIYVTNKSREIQRDSKDVEEAPMEMNPKKMQKDLWEV
jgi:hypothetical protein